MSSALMSFSVQTSLSITIGDASIVIREKGCEGNSASRRSGFKLNSMYMSDGSNYHFTMIYAVLNTQTGLMSYCCAGHPPLVWYHGKISTPVIGHNNFVVGAFDEIEYQSSIIQLDPSKVWFYSDGITEAENEAQDLLKKGLKIP